jgi:hypothetical protein
VVVLVQRRVLSSAGSRYAAGELWSSPPRMPASVAGCRRRQGEWMTKEVCSDCVRRGVSLRTPYSWSRGGESWLATRRTVVDEEERVWEKKRQGWLG